MLAAGGASFYLSAPLDLAAQGLRFTGEVRLAGDVTYLDSENLDQVSASQAVLDTVFNLTGVDGETPLAGVLTQQAEPSAVSRSVSTSGTLQVQSVQEALFEITSLPASLPPERSSILATIELEGAVLLDEGVFHGRVTLRTAAGAGPANSLTVSEELYDIPVAIDEGFQFPGPGASLSGLSWLDLDRDGIRAVDEPLLPNVKVDLFDSLDGVVDDNDVLVASMRSDSGGGFSFVNLDSGVYYAKFSSLPPGRRVTVADQGTDDELDSDVDPSSLLSPLFSLSELDHTTSLGLGVAAGSIYQNPIDRLNVNDDPAGEITPQDVVLILSDLFLNFPRMLPETPPPGQEPPPYIDVSGNGSVEPFDAAQVLSAIFLAGQDPVDRDAPQLLARPARDTGRDPLDGVTSRADIGGAVRDQNDTVMLRAGLDDTPLNLFTDVTSDLLFGGAFYLTSQRLSEIQGGPLADGAHVLKLQAQDEAGNVSETYEIPFQLDTTAPASPTANLVPRFDTAPLGDNITTFTRVGVEGQAEPGALVQGLGGLQVLADDGGDFATFNVPLEIGENRFDVQAVDLAGNVSSAAALLLTRQVAAGSVVLEESDQLVAESSQLITLGQSQGSRKLSFDVEVAFDFSSSDGLLEDSFHVYLLDPADPSTPLLAGGPANEALFSLVGGAAEFPAGLVTFDGRRVEIDVTSLAGATEGLLVFQYLNTDLDADGVATISHLTNDLSLDASNTITLPANRPLANAGEALDLSAMQVAGDARIEADYPRFNLEQLRYSVEIAVANQAHPLGRTLAVAFPNLPAEAALLNAQRTVQRRALYQPDARGLSRWSADRRNHAAREVGFCTQRDHFPGAATGRLHQRTESTA